MKTMRKLSMLVALLLVFALVLTGCGKKDVKYVVLDEALSDELYAIGFRKDDGALRDAVQQALCDMKKDGKLAKITKKWFGEDTSTVPDTFTATAQEGDTSLQKVKDAGKFRLGLDDSFPPMGYQDGNGNIIGYDIDLAREVCTRLGVELELVPIDWNQNVNELNSGNIDCVWNGMTANKERQEKMNLSEAYMNNRQVIVTLESNNIKTLADLKDKRIVLQKGSTAVEALDARSDIKSAARDVTEIKDNVLAMYELRQGTGDAVVMDEIVARYYIEHLTEMEQAATSN